MKAFPRITSQSVLAFSLLLPLSAQNAQDYFPSTVGNAWRYQRYELDSAQAVIAQSMRLETDSLTSTGTFASLSGSVIVTTGGLKHDTTIAAVSGSTISFYNRGFFERGLATVTDSLTGIFRISISGWYPYFQFGNPPATGKTDTVLFKDTSGVFEGTEIPLTFIGTAKRLSAVTVTVPAGSFTATRFVLALNANTYYFGEIPLLRLTDTVFVASGNWIVKEVFASTHFPVETLPIEDATVPDFTIPGYVRLLEHQSLLSVDSESPTPNSFMVSQNFPNPFNGTTEIEVTMERPSAITVTIYDMVGRTVAVLADESLTVHHSLRWDAGDISSGIYFYRVSDGRGTLVKKMILQK